MKNLKTDRLNLRIISSKDTKNIYNEILSNKDTLHFLDWPYCANINEANEFIKTIYILSYLQLHKTLIIHHFSATFNKILSFIVKEVNMWYIIYDKVGVSYGK